MLLLHTPKSAHVSLVRKRHVNPICLVYTPSTQANGTMFTLFLTYVLRNKVDVVPLACKNAYSLNCSFRHSGLGASFIFSFSTINLSAGERNSTFTLKFCAQSMPDDFEDRARKCGENKSKMWNVSQKYVLRTFKTATLSKHKTKSTFILVQNF